MISRLSRDRVIEEVNHLGREIASLAKRVEPRRDEFSPELEAQFDELETSILLARQFTSSNTMDFRRAELGLSQLRALKADIIKSLNEYGIEC